MAIQNLQIQSVNDYRKGNRLQVVNVLKLKWLSVFLTFIIYYHMFSAFKPPFTLWDLSCEVGKSKSIYRLLLDTVLEIKTEICISIHYMHAIIKHGSFLILLNF
jgi:hypothetical protein